MPIKQCSLVVNERFYKVSMSGHVCLHFFLPDGSVSFMVSELTPVSWTPSQSPSRVARPPSRDCSGPWRRRRRRRGRGRGSISTIAPPAPSSDRAATWSQGRSVRTVGAASSSQSLGNHVEKVQWCLLNITKNDKGNAIHADSKGCCF